MITIKLKKDITDLLEVDEESKAKHTEYIAPSSDVLAALGTTIKVEMVTLSSLPTTPTADMSEEAIDSLKYIADTTLLFKTVNKELIHWRWVDKIESENINIPNMDSSYIKVSKTYLIEKETGKLVNKADVKMCTNCGKPLDTHNEILCKACLIKKHFHIQSYSYKPTPIFAGTQTGTLAKTCPAWYGLELEYGLEDNLEMAQLCFEHESELFLKSDSSIEGGSHRCEMVSHPASFTHLMKSSSWVNKLDRLKAVNRPEKNGCHIHISRTAFKDNKHYAKFKFLIQENVPLVELIGGRKLNNYCNIMANKTLMFKTMKDGTSGDKYALCNEQHKDTIELRFMASSNKPAQVRRYIQYIDSMMKYTAYYGSSASYSGYYTYVTKYKTTYPDIFSILQANESMLSGEVTYKEAKFYESDILDLATKYFGAIVSAKFYGVDGVEEGKEVVYSSNNRFLVETKEDGTLRQVGGYSLQPRSKVIVKYAKI